MPTISYRDALSQTFDDKELVEYLVSAIDDFKNYGAWRSCERLPSHVIFTLIDRIKLLTEQQIGFYPKPEQAANEDDFNERNPPSVAYSDPE